MKMKMHVEKNNHIKYFKLILISIYETVLVNWKHFKLKKCSEKDIESKKLFFIFSLGRSGTQFLTRVLNNDLNTMVFHEPVRRDILEYAKSFDNNYNYSEYIKGFRSRFIETKVENTDVLVYGEVNSLLRRHAVAIMDEIPNVKGFYLIRDGRDVVRSMMSREGMSDTWLYKKISPKHDDKFLNAWPTMNQFEKCCWVWASENTILYEQFGPALKFEILLKDYIYFKSKLLDPLDLNIGIDEWQKERLIKSENKTKKFTCEPYSQWSVVWKDTFWKICGDMMQKNGYHNGEL